MSALETSIRTARFVNPAMGAAHEANGAWSLGQPVVPDSIATRSDLEPIRLRRLSKGAASTPAAMTALSLLAHAVLFLLLFLLLTKHAELPGVSTEASVALLFEPPPAAPKPSADKMPAVESDGGFTLPDRADEGGGPSSISGPAQTAAPAPAAAPEPVSEPSVAHVIDAAPKPAAPFKQVASPKPAAQVGYRAAEPTVFSPVNPSHSRATHARAPPAERSPEVAAARSVSDSAAAPLVPPQPVAGSSANQAPAYPESALRRREQGRVMLRVNVSVDGRPLAVDVAETSGFPTLDAAALAAVRQWRFTPATQAGLPVPASAEVPVRFRLDN